MAGHANDAAGINRRTALIGLGLGTGFATMRWSRVAAAEDPVVETACGKIRGTQQPGVTDCSGDQ
jgi:hypothetical protein